MKLHVQRTLYNDNRFSVFISDNETRGNIIYFFRIWTFLEKSPILQHGERGPELRCKLFPLFLPNDIRGHIANAKSAHRMARAIVVAAVHCGWVPTFYV